MDDPRNDVTLLLHDGRTLMLSCGNLLIPKKERQEERARGLHLHHFRNPFSRIGPGNVASSLTLAFQLHAFHSAGTHQCFHLDLGKEVKALCLENQSVRHLSRSDALLLNLSSRTFLRTRSYLHTLPLAIFCPQIGQAMDSMTRPIVLCSDLDLHIECQRPKSSFIRNTFPFINMV